MNRIPQPEGVRGSLKWIQTAVNENWQSLNQPIEAQIGKGERVEWRSPLQNDDFAEYRDGTFLELLDLSGLKPQLADFWPRGGPQWDALGITSGGTRLLVEAKAHVQEMCSPGSAASVKSLELIRSRLDATATALNAKEERVAWHKNFYQVANRLAHLNWLRDLGIDARLVMVNFLNDADMGGPTSASEWHAAYQVAHHVMGLGRRHKLTPYIIEVFPDVESQQT